MIGLSPIIFVQKTLPTKTWLPFFVVAIVFVGAYIAYLDVKNIIRKRHLDHLMLSGITVQELFFSIFYSQRYLVMFSLAVWITLCLLHIRETALNLWSTVLIVGVSCPFLLVLWWAASLVGAHKGIGYSAFKTFCLLPSSLFYVHAIPFLGMLLMGFSFILGHISIILSSWMTLIGGSIVLAVVLSRWRFCKSKKVLFDLSNLANTK